MRKVKIDLANYLFNLGREYQRQFQLEVSEFGDIEGQRIENEAFFAARTIGERAIIESSNSDLIAHFEELRERFGRPQLPAVPWHSDDDEIPY